MNNVSSLNKEKAFSKEGELSQRMNDLIAEYDGEISLVSVLGILDLKKMEMVYNND